ncbi:MAG: ROK family protein [Spirochaetaceae bacterium]|jgi:glucokinase|nr:ROK family protein [Spirochaetaceae bacterium]
MGYVMGIDVGGTKTALGLFDENKRLIAESRIASDPDLPAEEFFDVLIRHIKDLLNRESMLLEQVAGIGLGMPSFIIFEQGYIVKTSNLAHIHDFPARSYLSQRLGVPVFLDNDTHLAALAEHRYGAGQGYPNMLYCTLSTGVGSGIIINGKLFRGSYGWAGESGHTIVTPGEGILCGCGNRGCLMSWCSGSMIVKHIRLWIEQGEKTIMTELAGSLDHIDCFHVEQAYNRGDAMAVKAVDQMSRYLGLWLYNLYVTFNINCFVLGGGLLKMGDMLLEPIRRAFDGYNRDSSPVYIKISSLGDRFGIVGAAELIFEQQAGIIA